MVQVGPGAARAGRGRVGARGPPEGKPRTRGRRAPRAPRPPGALPAPRLAGAAVHAGPGSLHFRARGAGTASLLSGCPRLRVPGQVPRASIRPARGPGIPALVPAGGVSQLPALSAPWGRRGRNGAQGSEMDLGRGGCVGVGVWGGEGVWVWVCVGGGALRSPGISCRNRPETHLRGRNPTSSICRLEPQEHAAVQKGDAGKFWLSSKDGGRSPPAPISRTFDPLGCMNTPGWFCLGSPGVCLRDSWCSKFFSCTAPVSFLTCASFATDWSSCLVETFTSLLFHPLPVLRGREERGVES